MASFLTSSAFTSDLSKDSQYAKVDQLPPFNISMLFADEYGHMSYQRILGVEFVTTGNVHSIQDMLSEQTVSYVAVDFTPLLPYSKDTPFLKTLADMTQTHKTVQSVLIAADADDSFYNQVLPSCRTQNTSRERAMARARAHRHRHSQIQPRLEFVLSVMFPGR